MSRFGRYDVLALIGSGGMGSVYLARVSGVPGFEKPFALKVIHEKLAKDAEFVEMFMQEARIASQLHHHNIAQVVELGEVDGVHYIAMEHLLGQSLASVMNRLSRVGRPMDPRLAVHVASEAAAGLHFAHELTGLDGEPLGLVHRDVSPPNLFLTYEGAVKLLDFGIARAASETGTDKRRDVVEGKYPYMSPEQLKGRTVDRRSDVFALGVCLWEFLTGRRLFKGTHDAESIYRVLSAPIPTLWEAGADVPDAVESVVARALAREPEERYPSAGDLARDLDKVQRRLGGAVAPLEVADFMGDLFATEKARGTKLMWATMKMDPAALAADMELTRLADEGTPSRSGVRLRRDVDEGSDGRPRPEGSSRTNPAPEASRPSHPTRPSVPEPRSRLPGVLAGLAGAVLIAALAALVTWLLVRP